MSLAPRCLRLLAAALASLPLPALAQGADSYATSPVPVATQAAHAGHYADAERLLAPWLARHPDDEDALFLEAQVRFWEGRPQESLPIYDGLLAKEPQNVDYIVGRASVLNALGRASEAIPQLELARRIAPDDEEVWQLELGLVERAPGLSAQAAALRQAALQRFPKAAWLTTPTRGPWTLEAGGGFDFLSNGYANWTQAGFSLTRQFAHNQSAYLSAIDAGRFGIHDQEIAAGYFHPIGDLLTLDLEASVSPEHQVLAVWSAAAGCYVALPYGWDVAGDLRHTAYTAVSTTRELFVVDKYLNDFRVVYTLSLSELPGAPLAIGHAGTVEWDYGKDEHEDLVVHTGQEMEFIGVSNLLVSNVTGIEVYGRTWIWGPWGFTHGVDFEIQGTAYNRYGAQLGVLYAF